MAESMALYSSSSASPISSLRPAIASKSTTLSVVSLCRTSVPKFRGLKVRSSASNAQNATRPTQKPISIVSQAQDTAAHDIPTVTDSTWKSLVLNADGPVLVEFWAPWCGPCRMIHPVVGELAKEYAGKLTCLRLSTDDSPSIATQYGIRSVPTMMIFNKGEKKDTVLGAVPKTTLTASIVKYL